MGSELVQDLPDGYVSIGIWERGADLTVMESTYQYEEDVPYAGFTCEECDQPHKTHYSIARESKAWTKRCTECARRYQAYKRVRRMKELFVAERPHGATAVAITLTFGDEDIDKKLDVEQLRKTTMKRFAKLREKSEWWRHAIHGGIVSFECTKNKQKGTLHPHLHIVAWTAMKWPYPIDAFKEAMQAHGFGRMCTIETAYTKAEDGNKNYADPEGAIWYALKYALKDSILGEKKGRTVTKFGHLYGTKWNTDMSNYKQLIHRYRAVEIATPLAEQIAEHNARQERAEQKRKDALARWPR